ncbi:MAG TPA: CHASE domain-containing protein [Tepidisphaeraceae bacterium]|nr:CHASE domain-containing protein [Tepidisphaeraceae bacterium]
MSLNPPHEPPSSERTSAPWLVLVGMLLATAIAAEYVWRTNERSAWNQSSYIVGESAHEIRDAIHDRLDKYISLLRGASGLFAADERVTRDQFHEYVNRLDLRNNYRGTRGIGYVMRVGKDQAADVERMMREQGLPEFRIDPPPDDHELYPILYLEPRLPENNAVVGFDLYSDSVICDAMDRARDTGAPAASGKVSLDPEAAPGNQPETGFMVFMPVYQRGVDPGTVEERRQKLVGFVYCPSRVSDLLHGISDDPATARVNFALFDGPKAAAGADLHHTADFPDTRSPADRKEVAPTASDTLTIAGRTWTLVLRGNPKWFPPPSQRLAWGVLGAGFVFAGVLFLVMASQVRARAAAERAAAELRRSQSALERSEASLRRLVESNLIGVVISDSTGNVIEANDAFLSLTGYSRDDLRSARLNRSALTPPEYSDKDQQAAEQLATGGGHLPYEKEFVRKDGSRVPVLVGTTALDQDRRIGVSFIVDLSELRKAQRAVAENEQRFRTLFEQSPLGIQIFAPDGQVILANHAWERIWEARLSDLQGYNVLHDPQFEKIGLTPYMHQAFSGELSIIPPIRYDPALTGRPGRPRWVQFQFYPVKDRAGQVREVALILQDLSELKEAEEALRRSEEQLRLVIDALPVLVSYIDHEKRYRLNNQLYEEWFALPISEIEGKFMSELIDEEAWKIAEPAVDRALHGEHVEYDREMVFPDGSVHSVHTTLIPHVGLAGHVEGVVALAADVTERRAAENERARLLRAEQEARAEAETANRIKDDFLATLSHELRTPLNAILGWAQLIRMGSLPADEVVHGLQAIERNAKVQAQLVEDLLDLSRIISGKLRLEMRPIDLPLVLDAALDSVRPAAEAKNIQLIPLLDAAASPVLGDAGRLQQVIWNLLSNAIKFTPAGGKVELILQRVGGHAEILVSDTGMGINPDFLPYVFDRLRQADASSTRRHGGLGLGLSIARHLIESHGGTIRAQSAGENRGATFTVSLPLSPNAVVKDSASKSGNGSERDPSRRRKLQGVRVLVVDDEPDAREIVSHVLRREGADVRAAASAAEALGAIDESNPDVLVSDIAMPGQDGYELIRQLRSRDSAHGGKLPAIALTAFARGEDRDKALRAGYQTHLAKPVEPGVLSDAIAALTRHS